MTSEDTFKSLTEPATHGCFNCKYSNLDHKYGCDLADYDWKTFWACAQPDSIGWEWDQVTK